MNRTLGLLLVLLLCSQLSFSQENQLVYKKIIPGPSYLVLPSIDSTGYAVFYYWGLFSPSVVDIGVWSEINQSLIFDETSYYAGIVFYNSNFEPENSVFSELRIRNSFWLPSGQSILNFNGFSEFNTNSTIFRTVPPIDNYPSPTYGQNIFFKYDPVTETNTGLLNFSAATNDLESQEPFNGYNQAIQPQSVGDLSSKNTAIVSDSILVSYVLLSGEQTLNNTLTFTNWGGQINLVRLELNLNTNALNSQQIGSSTGSQFILRSESSSTTPYLWRAGIVRGNNTPVSVSGAELAMSQNDSLYHVYITKESISGETAWLTELYGYNNSFPDTSLSNDTKIFARTDINDILNINDNLYVSSVFYALNPADDTLMFRNFLGETSAYPGTSIIPQLSEALRTTYSKANIYKIDAYGNVTGKLTNTLNLSQYFASIRQNLHLFKIGDRLAWTQSYIALNDTVVEFTYTEADGSEQSIAMSLPAGKGSLVLWLNEDLDILDHWIIPYQSNNSSGGININSILPYREDTLLIQGVIGYNTSSDLNPFDDTEVVTVEKASSFFAFYAVPEIFTSSEGLKRPNMLQVYPNPGTGTIKILCESCKEAYNVRIMTVEGKVLDSFISNGEIRLDGYPNGFYLIAVKTKNGNEEVRKYILMD